MGLLFGGSIEDGTYFISDFFFKLFWYFSQHIACYMDLASLSLGVSKFFFEDCFQTRQSVHDSQTHIIGVQSSLFEVFEELPPTGGGFLVAAFVAQGLS